MERSARRRTWKEYRPLYLCTVITSVPYMVSGFLNLGDGNVLGPAAIGLTVVEACLLVVNQFGAYVSTWAVVLNYRECSLRAEALTQTVKHLPDDSVAALIIWYHLRQLYVGTHMKVGHTSGDEYDDPWRWWALKSLRRKGTKGCKSNLTFRIPAHQVTGCRIQSLRLNNGRQPSTCTQVCYSYATPALLYCFAWLVIGPVLVGLGIAILIDPSTGPVYYHSSGWLAFVVGVVLSLLTYLFLSFQVFLQVGQHRLEQKIFSGTLGNDDHVLLYP
jgi:hypothetical protein